jgi:hypothetical protein
MRIRTESRHSAKVHLGGMIVRAPNPCRPGLALEAKLHRCRREQRVWRRITVVHHDGSSHFITVILTKKNYAALGTIYKPCAYICVTD